jgi:hypothetical protein
MKQVRLTSAIVSCWEKAYRQLQGFKAKKYFLSKKVNNLFNFQ